MGERRTVVRIQASEVVRGEGVRDEGSWCGWVRGGLLSGYRLVRW